MGCSRSNCAGLDGQFDGRSAARDLSRYRKGGPDWTTRLLIDALAPGLEPNAPEPVTLLGG
jgi:hypothetical protein